MVNHVINHDRTQQLWQQFAAATDPDTRLRLRNQLVVHYRPLVKSLVSIACRTAPPHVTDPDDLVQAGTFGLIKAVEAFDPGRGVQFPTYAVRRIRGAICDWQRQIDWVPRRVRQRNEPIRTILSLSDERCQQESRQPLLEEIVDQRAPQPPRQAAIAEWWRNLLAGLKQVERTVVRLHYQRGLSFRQIAAALGCCESQVSKIHARVLRVLRASRKHLQSAP